MKKTLLTDRYIVSKLEDFDTKDAVEVYDRKADKDYIVTYEINRFTAYPPEPDLGVGYDCELEWQALTVSDLEKIYRIGDKELDFLLEDGVFMDNVDEFLHIYYKNLRDDEVFFDVL